MTNTQDAKGGRVKIYTRTGDKGMTSFIGNVRVKKYDRCIEAYGDLDELNSVIGVAETFVDDPSIHSILKHVQDDLFTLGAELASLELKDNTIKTPKVTSKHVKDIENYIDEITAHLPPQENFIIPGGTRASAFLHLCRTVVRRCERNLVRLDEKYKLNPRLLEYMNRISDLFYVLARKANKEGARKEQQPIYRYFKGESEQEAED